MKLATIEKIFAALNATSVRYLIVGGIAVNIHGYQRMTADLDLDDIEHLRLIQDETNG